MVKYNKHMYLVRMDKAGIPAKVLNGNSVECHAEQDTVDSI